MLARIHPYIFLRHHHSQSAVVLFPFLCYSKQSVPLKPHPFHARFQSSNYPLIVEIVARQIGTSGEQVIGTGEVDLTDLVAGLTRVIFINLNGGGSLNLRLKALDFGLPAGGVEPSQGPIMTETVRTTDTTIHVQSSKSGQTQHFSEGVMAADFGGVLE